jgi:hypothetical protein
MVCWCYLTLAEVFMFSLVLFQSPAVVHIMNEVFQRNFDLIVFLMFALVSCFGII